MPFILILIAALIIVSAIAGTQGQLAAALEQDLPGFFKWAVALAAVGALGYVPGLRTPSRWLLGLVLLVLFLVNYQTILDGFKSASASAPAVASVPQTPEQQYAAATGNPDYSAAGSTQTAMAGGTATALASAAPALSAFSPSLYLQPYEAGVAVAGMLGAMVG